MHLLLYTWHITYGRLTARLCGSIPKKCALDILRNDYPTHLQQIIHKVFGNHRLNGISIRKLTVIPCYYGIHCSACQTCINITILYIFVTVPANQFRNNAQCK